jgi:hypothetical protein
MTTTTEPRVTGDYLTSDTVLDGRCPPGPIEDRW